MHPAQRFERRLPCPQFFEQDQATPFEQGTTLDACFPARRFGQATEDLGQRRPAFLAFVQNRQGADGGAVGGRQFQHLVPQGDGLA
jgi:hypothetical protein